MYKYPIKKEIEALQKAISRVNNIDVLLGLIEELDKLKEYNNNKRV